MKTTEKKFTVIRKEGGSRVIAVTSFIPKEWSVINIIKVKEKDNVVTLNIEKVV